MAYSVNLNLPAKLRDREYRRKFFLAETSSMIAAQIIALRKRRGLNQKQLAELTNTKQPAISRVENADYQNWSFKTLRTIADALDARIRVEIEPSEDVFHEYETEAARSQEAVTTELPSTNVSRFIFDSVSSQNATMNYWGAPQYFNTCLFEPRLQMSSVPPTEQQFSDDPQRKLIELQMTVTAMVEEMVKLQNEVSQSVAPPPTQKNLSFFASDDPQRQLVGAL